MTDAGFDPDWCDFLRLLLSDPEHGLNLRNTELHDLTDDPQPHRVALVLAGILHLLWHAHATDETTTLVQDTPTSR
jgi:hypothetical protein